MENARLLFEQIINENYNRICRFIDEGQEEHLFLDFKEKSDSINPGLSKDDRKNYACALSGFSNSNGGVIVWGIRAKRDGEQAPDVAREKKPIKHLKKFLTDLNSLISDAIVPVNVGIENYLVYIDDNELSNEGFVITYVPEGQGLPYRAMCGENQYYQRTGDSFLKMEHHQLADMFGKRQKPNLSIHYRMENSLIGDKYKIIIIVGVENTGRFLATYPALRLKPINRLKPSDFGVSGNREWVLPPQAQSYDTISKLGQLFVGGINNAIHPGTILEIACLEATMQIGVDQFIFGVKHIPSVFSFEYEIYCEGCPSIIGEVNISNDELSKFIG